MKLIDAKKQVRAEKIKSNFMMIELSDSYGSLLLPHADALVFMQAITNAELLSGSRYSLSRCIKPLCKEVFSLTPFPRADYEDYKIAALLNITVSALADARAAAKNSTQET